MSKKSSARAILLIATLIILLAFPFLGPAQAQEEDGFKETFDDPTLPEWEHAREVVVTDSVLRMNPGSFALRLGDWSDITLTVRVRYTGSGEVFVNYYFRDEGRYGLMLRDDAITLEKEQHGSPTPLGNAEVAAVQQNTWITLKIVVSEGQHQVYVNDELQLTATDPEPLPTGAVMFQALGELTAEFDDLEVRGRPGGPPPEGEPGREPPPEGEPLPAEGGEPGVPSAGGQTPPPPEAATSGSGGIVEEFFASQASNLELSTFAINLVLAALCAYVLSLVYVHWGSSLTNRRKFAANFILMTITTTFVILVVRSSVALSLGLVGALSIVRFRTAIKEPEELAYLFFAIGLGIGLGDNQRLLTLLALAGGIAIIGLRRVFRKTEADVNLHLTVASHNPHKIELDQITNVLAAHAAKAKLMRMDERPETLEAAFLVEFRRISDLNATRAALRELSEALEITFLDNKGIW